jgi:hypothetical protein
LDPFKERSGAYIESDAQITVVGAKGLGNRVEDWSTPERIIWARITPRMTAEEKDEFDRSNAPLRNVAEPIFDVLGAEIGTQTVARRDFPPMSYKMEMTKTARALRNAVIGGSEMIFKGAINGAVRVGGGLYSIPYLFDSVHAAVAAQKNFGGKYSLEMQSQGARTFGRVVAPLVDVISKDFIIPATNFAESKIGIGATAFLKGAAQFGLETWGVASGMRSIAGAIEAASVRRVSMGPGMSPRVAMGIREAAPARVNEVGQWQQPSSRTGCFIAGTQVWTRDGLKAIESIRIGDFVLSQPEMTGEQAYRQVNDTFIFYEKVIYRVEFVCEDGDLDSVYSTPNHPFFVLGTGWTGAEFLKVGDTVLLHNGKRALVSFVGSTEHTDRVYNFEVDGFHTYYVGRFGVWVHNVDCGKAETVALGANSAGNLKFGNVPDSINTSSGIPIQPTPRTTTTVLGSYANDMNDIINRQLSYPKTTDFGPKPGGFNVLNVPDEMYKTPDQFWNEINRPFLDAAMKRGDEIPLATRPTADLLYRDDGSLTGFGREVQHLTTNGYHYDAVTGKMVPN